MVNNLVNSVVGSIYIGADKRTILDNINTTSYQPLSNNNVLFVYLENAFGNSGVVTASFKSGTQRIPTTQPFFLRFIKDVSKVVGGEVTPRHFSKYILTIPQPVANLNLNKTEPLNIHTTINVSSSIKFIGTFNTLVDLTAHVGSVEKDIAYVIESGIYGYYEYVLDNGSLKWLRIENDDISRKVIFSQYGFFDIGIQGGYFSEVPHTNINDWQEYVIWQEINQTNYRLAIAETDIDDLEVDLGETKNRVEQNETNIENLKNRVSENENSIDIIENDILEIKSDINELDGRLTTAETDIQNLENDKVDKTVYNADKITQDNRDVAQENRLDTVEIDVANLENQNLLHSPTFNGTNGHLTFQRYGASPIVIDLPTEMIVTSGVYDDINNELVLNLASGGEVRIPVGNLLTDLDAENIRYNGAGTYYLSGKNRVEQAINELDRQIKVVNDTLPLKIDKDFTSYPELTAPEVADDDLIIVRDMSSNSVKKMRVATLRQHESNTIEYGIREIKGQTSSTFQRLKRVNGELFVGEATNLVANVGVGSQVVVNSFDNIAIFNTTKVIIDGNVKVKRPLYFHKHETAIVGADVVIDDWICDKQLTNYIRPQIFIGDNGEPMDFAYLGAYQASEINGVARSVSGEFPRVDINRNNSRILARKNDGDGTNTNSRWGIKDLADYHYHITIPFWVEFATKNSQSILQGATNMPYNTTDIALYTASSTNEIIITNVQANSYRLEQTIAIGTERGGIQVANNRILKTIQLDTPNIGEATLTFDGDAVDITAGNVVYTRGWRSGMTDGVVASSGYYLENSNKVPIVFRNYENPYGNIYEFTDGGKISNHQLWVTTDRSAYNDVPSVGGNYAEPFKKVSYINALTNDYIMELGYDSLFPFARLPIVVGGNSATYYADYYYQDVGDRTILSGGSWAHGVSAGLSLWLCNYALATSGINIGFRLSYKPF